LIIFFFFKNKEQVQKRGTIAFNQTLDFDEFQTLKINLKYLQNTLNLSNIDIKYTDEPLETTTSTASFDDIVPGKPLIFYE
jgi:hypothetical protein